MKQLAFTTVCTILVAILINPLGSGNLTSTILNDVDGGEMVCVPSGSFLMGSQADAISSLLEFDRRVSKEFFRAEYPQHEVFLSSFYIDRYMVTNAQYQLFMQATGHPAPKYWRDAPDAGGKSPFPVGEKNPDHPVVGVSWQDASAYCKWAGKRLPSEAEWEKAARGGLMGQIYPWPSRIKERINSQLSREKANYGGVGGPDRWHWTAPVGSFPPNQYGIFDMAGNGFEWCNDWYAEDYYSRSLASNPLGPETGLTRILRGGSWNNNLFGKYQMRCAYRFHSRPDTRNMVIGFRCAVDAPPLQ